LLIDNRDDDDRDVGERRIALQRGENRPPVDVGHHDVEGHRRRPQLAELFYPFDPARCGLDGKAFPGEICRDQLARSGIIVDYQDRAATILARRRVGRGRASGG